MCMTLGCYPQIILHFSRFELNQFLPKHIGTGFLANTTSPTILLDIFEVLQLFLFRYENVHVIEYNMDFRLELN